MARTYKQAGVNELKAEELISYVSRKARSTFNRNVLENIGFFAGLYAIPKKMARECVLVSSCDGVGTKILIADLLGRYDTIGIDLVAMNVNDVAVTGAQPLFFLDYLAIGRLKGDREKAIIAGVVKGCRETGCALIGGETAQMRPVYGEDGFDLAAFCVGAVERRKILGPARVKAGHLLIGINSNGVHSNGFSLIQKIFPLSGKRKFGDYVAELGRPLGEEFLRPTFIYAPLVRYLAERGLVSAAAHITGGGIPGNLVRILPEGCTASVRKKAWKVPPVFTVIADRGGIGEREMFNVFNMGIGLILSASERNVAGVIAAADAHGLRAQVIGAVRTGHRGVEMT